MVPVLISGRIGCVSLYHFDFSEQHDLCLMFAGPEPKPPMKGETRTFRVQLDCNQYQKDMVEISTGKEVY